MKIFITGATGFLGYHIANACIAKGHQVLCLRRTTSVSLFNDNVEHDVLWVNSDEKNWKTSVVNFQPDVLIHCAWSGVSAEGRNDRNVQNKNILLSDKIFKLTKYKQIIVLGSQEEYGRINEIVDENYPLNPITEYAKAKISTCEILKNYAAKENIEWQWIRVFTVYGEKQKDSWLIPSMIKRCKNLAIKEMDTTRGEQIYSYLYSLDFANAVLSVVGIEGKSGIYNLSSTTPTMLNDLFEAIRQKTHSHIIYNKVLPYREYQSMLVMGNCDKFKNAFGEYEATSLSHGLDNTINSL